jgi:hypothetical protein
MHSGNEKTGDMVQTHIIADEEIAPHKAIKTGQDAAVCGGDETGGGCKHRPINGGACYVLTFQGPRVVHEGLRLGRYPAIDPAALGQMVAGRMIRLGTYGDPMAVPAWVWECLVSEAAGRTGYSHQWDNPAIDSDQKARVMALTMASVDNVAEADKAKAAGLRYFRIRTADETLGPREFVCPASTEAGYRKNCATCGACDGSERGPKASPVIIVHGATASRFAKQRRVILLAQA